MAAAKTGIAKKPRATAAACVHKFEATKGKAYWVVKAKPINNRGEAKDVEVPVTVFKCSCCGELKEYPDIWESNFTAPVMRTKTVKPAIKRAAKTKA
ncbi:MAG TPA: hypothetical protein PLK80_13595 [bacterium]|nr:hypothetical protein [bacterium]HPI77760.1 hypothetical protein [bacterium]